MPNPMYEYSVDWFTPEVEEEFIEKWLNEMSEKGWELFHIAEPHFYHRRVVKK